MTIDPHGTSGTLPLTLNAGAQAQDVSGDQVMV